MSALEKFYTVDEITLHYTKPQIYRELKKYEDTNDGRYKYAKCTARFLAALLVEWWKKERNTNIRHRNVENNNQNDDQANVDQANDNQEDENVDSFLAEEDVELPIIQQQNNVKIRRGQKAPITGLIIDPAKYKNTWNNKKSKMFKLVCPVHIIYFSSVLLCLFPTV